MKGQKLFLKIYIPFVIVITVALIVLQILGSKTRIGYLTDFQLNNFYEITNSDNTISTNYVYHFKIRYYDKIFKHSDIYGVYPDLSNLPDYIKEAEMDMDGSPFGNFVSSKIIEEDKIDNIEYILKIKIKLYLTLFLIIVLLFLIYILYLIFKYLLINKKINEFVILFLIFFILLFFNFNFNVFSLADNKLFKLYSDFSASIVLDNTAIRDLIKPDNFFFLYHEQQKETGKYNDNKFVDELKDKNIGFYKSCLGGQQFILKPINIFLYFLDNSSLKYSQIYKFQQLYIGTLTALVIAIFMTFLAVEFGILPVFISMIFLIFTNVWLTIFAKHIWWNAWSYYLPLLIVCYHTYKYNFNNNNLILYALFVISLLIRFSMGYEFISTIMIAYTLPIFYFAVSRNWTFKKFLNKFFIISALCILSFIITLFIHIIALGDTKHIVGTLFRRTSNKYLDWGRIIQDNGILAILDLYLNKNTYSFPYINIVIILILVILLRFIFDKKQDKFGFQVDYKKYLGLLLCVIISFFGAISHQIIFRQHSFVHTTLNYITFFMPFLFLAYILILLKPDVKIFDYIKVRFKKIFTKK